MHHRVAVVDEPLDRVGDLELVARRRLDRPYGLVDRCREDVDPDQREIRRRVGGLLDEPDDAAVRVDLGHAELAGVVDVREQDLGRGRSRGSRPSSGWPVARREEPVDEGPQVVLQHVVAEVHDEVVVAEEVGARSSTQCASPSGCVLRDVGELDPELGAVAERGLDLGRRSRAR